MANATKLTKVEKFNAIANALVKVGVEELTVGNETFSVSEFCTHEVELITAKAEKSREKKAVDNSSFYPLVEQALENGALTPTELMAKIGVPNTQKVASIVKGMSNINKTVKGKKVFYSLV